MENQLKNIEKQLHRSYLNTLNIYRCVQQDDFKVAWNAANAAEQLIAKNIIDTLDYNQLLKWIEKILITAEEYDYITVKQLREFVKAKTNINIYQLTKMELIYILKCSKNKEKEIDKL